MAHGRTESGHRYGVVRLGQSLSFAANVVDLYSDSGPIGGGFNRDLTLEAKSHKTLAFRYDLLTSDGLDETLLLLEQTRPAIYVNIWIIGSEDNLMPNTLS